MEDGLSLRIAPGGRSWTVELSAAVLGPQLPPRPEAGRRSGMRQRQDPYRRSSRHLEDWELSGGPQSRKVIEKALLGPPAPASPVPATHWGCCRIGSLLPLLTRSSFRREERATGEGRKRLRSRLELPSAMLRCRTEVR